MPLVVPRRLITRRHKDHPVATLACFVDQRYASGQRSLTLCGLRFHPGQRGTLERFRLIALITKKAGCKGFRQHIEICPRASIHQGLQVIAVGPRILPAKLGLHQGDC